MEFRETEQAETARLVELTLWIEGNIKTWNERGVDVLQKDGQYLWSWMDATGKVGTGRLLFFGTVADCAKRPLKESDFVKLIVSGDMGFEHCCILIHNAVDQVAGR